jgi:hypothetical protein
MTRFFALVAVLAVSAAATAAPLRGSLVKSESNVATFDPNIFAPGPAIDIYHVVIENPNASATTSVGLTLDGSFINLGAPAVSFRNSAALPTLGPNKVAESFFVIPADKTTAQVLAVNTEDTAGVLSTSFTIQGGANLIPAGGSSILAVLSVAAGSPEPSQLNWTGNGAVNGVLEAIQFIPEPTTCVLAGLALVGAAARRRV